MISRLPKWVWVGGALLAFCAGMVNVIALLGFTHKAATHVTGICSLFSISILDGDLKNTVQTLLIIASFFLGAIFAGLIVGDAHLRMGRRYGFALAVECGLLLVSTHGFIRGLAYGEYFAGMAAGLQNAMASTYSEAIVRTTHLTGVLTDLGGLIGNKLRGVSVDKKRFNLLATIFFSFLSGSFAGGFCYHLLGAMAMLFPALIIGASALSYEIFRRKISTKSPVAVTRLVRPSLVEVPVEAGNR